MPHADTYTSLPRGMVPMALMLRHAWHYVCMQIYATPSPGSATGKVSDESLPVIHATPFHAKAIISQIMQVTATEPCGKYRKLMHCSQRIASALLERPWAVQNQPVCFIDPYASSAGLLPYLQKNEKCQGRKKNAFRLPMASSPKCCFMWAASWR